MVNFSSYIWGSSSVKSTCKVTDIWRRKSKENTTRMDKNDFVSFLLSWIELKASIKIIQRRKLWIVSYLLYISTEQTINLNLSVTSSSFSGRLKIWYNSKPLVDET